MTTSLYMPDVKVELGFGYGYSTPLADIVWTDVSEWVELAENINISFGRGDERSTADANSVSLTFDNADGRFTALRTGSPYYPNVRIGVPIRVTSTPVGGADSVRFVGYVDEWPVAWDGTDEYAMAAISATSRLARLGLDMELRSAIEETILPDAPFGYYPLGEAEGATTASDVSGNASPPLAVTGSGTGVVFGNAIGIGGDGLTAAEFAGGMFLTAGLPGTIITGFACFFRRSGSPAVAETVIAFNGGAAEFVIETNGRGSLYEIGTLIAQTSTSIADGATHHVFVIYAAGGGTLYVDGAAVGSAAHPVVVTFTGLLVTVGGGGNSLGPANFTGTLSHVEVYQGGNPSAARIAAHSAAGVGFAGETSDDRLLRYAEWAGIAASEVDADSATTTLAAKDSTGSTAVDMMRQVESTEGGVLFDGRDGMLTFHARSRRYVPTSTLTLDMAAQQVGADFAPTYDRAAILNDVTVASADGTALARAVDAVSRDDLGRAATSLESLSSTTDGLASRANWTVHAYSEPRVRAPQLTVNLLDFDVTPSQDDILAVTIGTLITVTNQPAQASVTDGRYFAEGYTETIGPESYTFNFNVSPAEPWMNVLILNDPVRGALNSGNVLAW